MKPLIVLLLMVCAAPLHAGNSWSDVVAISQPRMVKIFGAGGLRGLESYQSGFFISERGHILTVWSYVLDTESVVVVTNHGRRYEAELVGADPRLEIAILKVESDDVDYFELQASNQAMPGDRILAFGNLFGVAVGDEQPTVLHGTVAPETQLAARRGAYRSRYQGPVYVLDAMTNNPGAAGGALTDLHGQLLGILGKELRNAYNNTWLNYAIPTAELTSSVADILSGKILPRSTDEQAALPDKPHSMVNLGIVMVPNVLDKTPPFIERVIPNSPAFLAGLRPDDLILFVDGRTVASIGELMAEVRQIHRDDVLPLQVLRDGGLVDVQLYHH